MYSFADTYTTKHLSVSVLFPNNQPPGSLYILSGTYESYILTGKVLARLTHTTAGSLTWINTYLQHIFMKSPPLITDMLMGVLAFLLVAKEAGRKRGLLAASFILFNPVIFYNSAIWGQMDSINNFFFLLALFFAFRRHPILSIFSYAISLYIKLSLLPFLPFYLVFLFFQNKKKFVPILIGMLVSIGGILLATIPVSHSPLTWLITQLPIITQGELQNITVAAFNFWWAATCFPAVCNGNNIPVVSQLFLGISLHTWGYILFAIFSLPLMLLQFIRTKKMIIQKNIFLLFSLVALITFLFLPNMHDRYMYPFFPLFAVVIGLTQRNKLCIVIFCLLILLHMSNLLYSWYPTYFPAFFFYQILYSTIFRWAISAITVVVFGWIYWISLQESAKTV